MKFSYETQGAITYLVCELEVQEQLDSLTLGMLTNNHIAGLAPVLYTEMNGQQFLKFNISAKVSSEQFFGGNMNKQRTLQAFGNILDAMCNVDEYMIDQNCFSILPEHVFLNVSNCEVALICVPVISDKDIDAEVKSFFKNILTSSNFDSTEDSGYVAELEKYIDSDIGFSVYGLNDLVKGLASGAIVPTATAPTLQPSPVMKPATQPEVQIPPVNVAPAPTSVSSFDSTISIDEMPAMLAAKQAEKEAAEMQPEIKKPEINPAPIAPQPVTPVAPQPIIPTSTQPVVKPAPVSQPSSQPQPVIPVPNNQPNNIQRQGMQPKPNAPVPVPNGGSVSMPPKPPINPVPTPQNGPGFAIPGQGPMGANNKMPPQGGANPPSEPSKTKEKGEKKMSLFGLLANYSKENAELYKKQKEEAKQTKGDDVAAKPEKAPKASKFGKKKNDINEGAAPINSAVANPQPIQPQPVLVNQSPQPQPFTPPVQPVPVQNSFNETTVLSPMMAPGGETTVLGSTGPNPTLIRVKTGEHISINKPVFRIGKEKSYVDYFVADNTAISRSHANIHTENGEYFVEDTNSTNHTYINGAIINSNVKTKIKSGDKVRLANEEFTFTV